MDDYLEFEQLGETRNLKEFLKFVMPHSKNFSEVFVNKSDLINLQSIVIKSLKMKSVNELRDRIDGISYYNKFKNKALGLLALQKFLKIDLLDANVNPKSIKTIINIRGEDYNIVTFDFGSLPTIDTSLSMPHIFIVLKDFKTLWICGFANQKVIMENHNNNFLRDRMNIENKSSFIGFNKLESINKLKYNEL